MHALKNVNTIIYFRIKTGIKYLVRPYIYDNASFYLTFA